jgi:tRNA1(Val) A37 N6-methylase TrmN6
MNCVPIDERWPGGLSDDGALGGRLRLLQPRRGHRFGHDAILLAAATAALPGERAADLGAGVGAAGLALAARVPGLSVTLVEIDPDLAALARENAARNALGAPVSVIVGDVAALATEPPNRELGAGAFDRVLMNPPFRDPARHMASPEPVRRRAHSAPAPSLAAWIGAASRLLRPDGVLTLIFPAERLADALANLSARFGAVAILPVHAKPAAPAIRVLVRAAKGSRAPLALLPGLPLSEENGRPSAQAEAVLRDGAVLPLAQM